MFKPKPQGNVQLNRNSQFFKGLGFCSTFQDQLPFDLVNQVPAVVAIGNANTPTKGYGTGFNTNVSNGRIEFPALTSYQQIGQSPGLTAMVVADFKGLGGPAAGIIAARTSFVASLWEIYLNSGIITLFGGSGVPLGTMTTGEHCLIVTSSSVGSASYLDGTKATGGTSLGTFSAAQQLVLGTLQAGDTSNRCTANFSLAAVWQRAMNEDEVRVLQADPFQIVRSNRQRTYFYPSAAARSRMKSIITIVTQS